MNAQNCAQSTATTITHDTYQSRQQHATTFANQCAAPPITPVGSLSRTAQSVGALTDHVTSSTNDAFPYDISPIANVGTKQNVTAPTNPLSVDTSRSVSSTSSVCMSINQLKLSPNTVNDPSNDPTLRNDARNHADVEPVSNAKSNHVSHSENVTNVHTPNTPRKVISITHEDTDMKITKRLSMALANRAPKLSTLFTKPHFTEPQTADATLTDRPNFGVYTRSVSSPHQSVNSLLTLSEEVLECRRLLIERNTVRLWSKNSTIMNENIARQPLEEEPAALAMSSMLAAPAGFGSAASSVGIEPQLISTSASSGTQSPACLKTKLRM